MPKEACGICGICGRGVDVARFCYFGILAEQHRGQESAGIACSDGKGIRCEKQAGRVDRFKERQIRRLAGSKKHPSIISIGHTRYSNTGSNRRLNFQPFVVETAFGPLGLAHNGNLIDPLKLSKQLRREGIRPEGTTDSELIALMIAYYSRSSSGVEEAIQRALTKIKGAYSLVIATKDKLIGLRDPWGIRPLCLGILNGTTSVIASETCALEAIGAKWQKEIEPGEMVVIKSNGEVKTRRLLKPKMRKLCIFEFIYFAFPTSILYGCVVKRARCNMGKLLYRENPLVVANHHEWIVCGVPDTAIPAAIGYAEAARLRYSDCIAKNRYLGRTFIQPDQHLRKIGVRAKLYVVGADVRGKKVVVVEDSIVRANTSRQLVQRLREAGSKEVHMRITSPPYKYRCLTGIDTQYSSELIASKKSVEEIRKAIGADSLYYLSLEGVTRAIREENKGHHLPGDFCAACFTGEYPIPISQNQGRSILES